VARPGQALVEYVLVIAFVAVTLVAAVMLLARTGRDALDDASQEVACNEPYGGRAAPPGHGGTPPGHGGTPPGQGGENPGRGRAKCAG
jgi:Flp pilus assembly pilin Flp